MKKGIKTVSAVLVLSLATGSLSGCSKLFEGKKKKAQEEIVMNYLQACVELNYDDSEKYVKRKDDAFQDVSIEDERIDLVMTCLSCAQFEVVKNEEDVVTVNFTAPDVDKTIRTGHPETYSSEEITAMIEGSDDLEENTFEFEMVEEDGNWVIEPESTEEPAEYISNIAIESAPVVYLGMNGSGMIDSFLMHLANGEFIEAMAMTSDSYIPGSSSDVMGIGEYYRVIVSQYVYEVELDSVNNDDSAIVIVSGTRPDFTEGSMIANEDHDIMIAYTTAMLRAYVESGWADIYIDPGYDSYQETDVDAFVEMSEAAYSDYMSAVAEVAPTEDFTMNMHVNLGEDYRLTINEYDALMIMGTTGTPVVTREFYEESLHILLDDGTITQDQYDQFMAVDPEYFML